MCSCLFVINYYRFLKPFLEECKQAVFKEICGTEKMQCVAKNELKQEQGKLSKLIQLKEKVNTIKNEMRVGIRFDIMNI